MNMNDADNAGAIPMKIAALPLIVFSIITPEIRQLNTLHNAIGRMHVVVQSLEIRRKRDQT